MPIDYLKDSLEFMGFDIEDIEYPDIIALIMDSYHSNKMSKIKEENERSRELLKKVIDDDLEWQHTLPETIDKIEQHL